MMATIEFNFTIVWSRDYVKFVEVPLSIERKRKSALEVSEVLCAENFTGEH